MNASRHSSTWRRLQKPYAKPLPSYRILKPKLFGYEWVRIVRMPRLPLASGAAKELLAFGFHAA